MKLLFEFILKEVLSVVNMLDIAQQLQNSDTKLVFIPELVKKFSPGEIEGGKKVILHAAKQGLVELRPESGLNRLSSEEKKCV